MLATCRRYLYNNVVYRILPLVRRSPGSSFGHLQTYGIGLALLICTIGVYVNWPPPELPASVQKWSSGGRVFIYKHAHFEHRIFFRDDEGSGRGVLVCLHGFPTSSYDWVKIWPKLKNKFSRVISPDFLGFGLSDKPRRHYYIDGKDSTIIQEEHKYSIVEQASIVEALLNQINVTSVHILSHDYGDTVAQELVHRFNGRQNNEHGLNIMSLCLLNGGIFPEVYRPLLLQKLLAVPWIDSVLMHLMNSWTFSSGLAKTFGPNSQPTAADMEDWWSLLRRLDGNLVVGKILSYIAERRKHRDNWVGALQNTTVPIHMVFGAQDVVNPHPQFSTHFRKHLPNATIDVLMPTGHYPHWEDPEGVLQSYFANFLDERKLV